MDETTLASLGTGALLGLAAGISPGPLLTLVITETLTHSVREGLKVSLSPLITDLPIIAFSVLVLMRLSSFEPVLGVITLAGGAYLAWLGIDCINTKPIPNPTERPRPRSLSKGVATNALNPHPYLFWITVGAPMILTSYQESGLLAPALFLTAFYSVIVTSKMTVAIITGRFRQLLANRFYLLTMKILGAALFLFAVLFVRDGLKYLGITA